MATNYAQATYTEVIDLQTVADHVSIIGIHTPRGMSPYNRLKGFFTQFRKYKYNGIKSLVMVPAANLPVDPLGLTGQQQTTDLMDPRDMLNPILFHGCHGESLTYVLNQIYGKLDNLNFVSNDPDLGNVVKQDSTDDFVHVSPSALGIDNEIGDGTTTFDLSNYYAKLTDSTWKKFGIQSGVKLRNLHPLVHKVARNMPLIPGAGESAAQFGELRGDAGAAAGALEYVGNRTDSGIAPNRATSVFGDGAGYGLVPGQVQPGFDHQYMTNGMTSLGWMPTSVSDPQPTVAILPKIFMGLIILPPAYNIEQYFRMVITHSFSFKDFTSSLGLMDAAMYDYTPDVQTYQNVPYTNWIDYGDTTDSIGAKAEVISDGVM